MAIEIIIIIFVFAYFIKEQFEFAPVTRLRYLLLPIGGMIVFLSMLNGLSDWILAACLAVVAVAIGRYQATSFAVTYKYVPTDLVYRGDGIDQPIQKRQLYSRGGRHYLYGWIIIATLQIGLSMVKHGLHISDLPDELLNELLKDLFLFFRITDSESGWWVWELYSISSIAYLGFLIQHSKEFAHVILKKDS